MCVRGLFLALRNLSEAKHSPSLVKLRSGEQCSILYMCVCFLEALILLSTCSPSDYVWDLSSSAISHSLLVMEISSLHFQNGVIHVLFVLDFL